MNIKNLDDQYFLFASNMSNISDFFQGYCFVSADYIFGNGGRKRYVEETRSSTQGGEDDC